MSGNIHKILRLRSIATGIDFALVPFLCIVMVSVSQSLLGIEQYQANGIFEILGVVVLCLLGIISIQALLIVLTKGYTIGGVIMGVKLVSLNSNLLNIKTVILRITRAFSLCIYSTCFMHLKYNNLGQLYYDEEYQTTIIRRGDKLENLQSAPKKYFEISFIKWSILGVFIGYMLVFGILALILKLN